MKNITISTILFTAILCLSVVTAQALASHFENGKINLPGYINGVFQSEKSVTSDSAKAPEPAIMFLFGTGLAGLATVSRKKMKYS